MLDVNLARLGYGDRTLLSADFSLKPGEVLAISGPSGSGKSTLLQWLLGAPPPGLVAEGTITLNGRRCERLAIEQRQIGILFQEPLLFSHLSVLGNLLCGMPGGWHQRSARRLHAEQALEAAGLAGFGPRDPATLSGGQRARVALLRALLARPQALLLDEPFSRLDPALADRFRHWVFATLAQRPIPVVLVTHQPQDIPLTARHLQLMDGRLVPVPCANAR